MMWQCMCRALFRMIIYVTKFVCTKICIHQALVNLLHVSARRRCRHQGERNVGYVNWKDVCLFFNQPETA